MIDLTQRWQVLNADCLDVLRQLPDGCVDAVVTDPPYGIGFVADRQRANRPNGGGHKWKGVKVHGDDKPFDPAPLLALGVPMVLWGGNAYADKLPPSYGWLVWDKSPNGVREGFVYSHAEMAWTNVIGRVQKFSLEWNAGARDGEPFLHPTQKSTALMRWCLSFMPAGCTVLDPFCGSGTTGVACMQTGRRFIGIEIDAGYCDIARRRIAEAANTLWTPPADRETDPVLIPEPAV